MRVLVNSAGHLQCQHWPFFALIVANEVSDLMFKTINFHHYTQGVIRLYRRLGGGAAFGWGKF